MKILGKTWFRILVSGGLMLLLLTLVVDLPAALRAIRDCDWTYMGYLAVWITLDRLLMAYKWRILVTCRGVELGLWESIKAYYLASFAGCFLPSTVGADAMRIASVSGTERPSEVMAASVVMERALGFVAAAMAAALALVVFTSLVAQLPANITAWSLGILGISMLAVLLSLSSRLTGWMKGLDERSKNKNALLRWLSRFLGAYAEYRSHRGSLAWVLFLSFIEQAGPVVGTWLAALALEINLSLLEAAAVTPLALLFTRIPVSFSGFGVVEGLYVAFFALVGLNATDSFLLGLVATLSIVATTVPGAFFYGSGGLKTRKEA